MKIRGARGASTGASRFPILPIDSIRKLTEKCRSIGIQENLAFGQEPSELGDGNRKALPSRALIAMGRNFPLASGDGWIQDYRGCSADTPLDVPKYPSQMPILATTE